jgi:hypothetical protein
MSSVESLLLPWGVLGILFLFVLGVAADELIRAGLHKVADRRLAYAFHAFVLSLTARNIPVELERTYHVAVAGETTREASSAAEVELKSVAGALQNGFDNVERMGESIVQAVSKRDPRPSVRIDAEWTLTSGGADLAMVAKISGSVPYWGLDRALIGLLHEFEWVQSAMNASGKAATYDPKSTTLRVQLRKSVEVVDNLRRINVSTFQGEAPGFRVDLDSRLVTLRGEFGAGLTLAASELVTWYY